MNLLAAIIFITSTAHATLPVSIVFNNEPHCQSAKRQWETQHRLDERSHAYYRRFMGEFKQINETCDVRILESHEARPQSEYPAIRFGYGPWITIKRDACFPGVFIPAIRDICGDYNYELGDDYLKWLECQWKYEKPMRPDVSLWIETPKSVPVDAPEPPELVE